MVGVLVRDEYPSQVFWCPANSGQALANLAQAEARIDQDASLIGLQIGAIARGTAAQDGKANRHSLRYERGKAGATINWLSGETGVARVKIA